MANPNLMRQPKGKKPQKKRNTPAALIVSVIIIIISAGVYLAFFLIGMAYESQAEEVQDEILQKNQELDDLKEEAREAQSFVNRMNNIETIMADHTWYSGLMHEIEQMTDKRIQYLGLSEAEEGVVSLEGRAQDYAAVERLLVSLNGSELLAHARINSVTYSLDEETEIVTVDFSLTLELERGVLLEEPSEIDLKGAAGEEAAAAGEDAEAGDAGAEIDDGTNGEGGTQ